MPFNVLLLPLLGGYLFITLWNRTRFDTKRYSGERLIFHSAVAGVLFLVAAFAVVKVVVLYAPRVDAGWRAAVPFKYSGTSLGAFLVGAVAWWPLNRWVHPLEKEARRTIAKWNDFLEVLLTRALDEAKAVSVTLKSRKVYIGFITGGLDPINERKYLIMLPMQSGYREPETLNMRLVLNYAPVYAQLIQQNNQLLLQGIRDFRVVLPVAEIQSVNLFDSEAYTHFPQG
jgi:hypothetical protein